MRNRQERYMGMDEDELYRMKMERSSRRISPRKDEEEEILEKKGKQIILLSLPENHRQTVRT